ncbi:MAG: hydantoinase B/oxoprolinase family protein [Desulfobulbaceae bacterium]|uniref:Hydantoinase B/oxoprolinase family protein n=1 Tax=Candidatus Desulfatifera sulfidica TaxID=2841691 RepID=A0A8J6NBJ8_9BACT|nr:hydantoinase B/oxoprolinase family protein [Candidatus Desulfatifera sulfidica]
MLNASSGIRIAVDRGGTFTDIYAEDPSSDKIYTEKLLSDDPNNYSDAPREGIRRIMERISGQSIAPDTFSSDGIDVIRMGTTVATNALLERTGVPTALLITKGFRDLLFIGDQTRPDLFDLRIKRPDLLYQQVVEVDERIRPFHPSTDDSLDVSQTVNGRSGKKFLILKQPDPGQIRSALQDIYNQGLRSLAVVLIHAYDYYDHELFVGEIAKEIGFQQISLSHQVMPKVKMVARGDTTTVDAYLTPHIQRYLDSFIQGFSNKLSGTRLLFMQSDGGLTAAEKFKGANAILSGPAGGVVGYGLTSFSQTKGRPVIGFDMGGTSTDVSRYDGEFELIQETQTAGVRIQASQMHIKTVAAGGGSRLFFQNNMLQVGPDSAGAHPGPVCYRKNGYLAITDANLILGRLQPDFFPHIFGENEDLPLHLAGARQSMDTLTARINLHMQSQNLPEKSSEELALGFLDVANEEMARPIRELSVMRGYDIKEHILACFGGAGGQHACAVARKLGINTILIHNRAGILSAVGISMAEIVIDRQETASGIIDDQWSTKFIPRLTLLEENARLELLDQPPALTQTCAHYLNLRFSGTDTPLMIQVTSDSDPATLFRDEHLREFGFLLHDRPILVDDVRVRITTNSRRQVTPHNSPQQGQNKSGQNKSLAHQKPDSTVNCYFQNGWQQTPLYRVESLAPDRVITGPAILIQAESTILLEPNCEAILNEQSDILITLRPEDEKQLSGQLDPIQLSIFSNLFMSIAEQMGRTLQKTAISTNIKERLDFSCAIFDQNGGLVANAPHIPVHLGAMGEAVQKQIELRTDDLKPGDVLVSNHPLAGGSHLPDITVITPLWYEERPLFYVASRGHHADIGGISPGSMPPFSKTLSEEGAAILSCKLIADNTFQEQDILSLLTNFADPTHTPPISAARYPADNISDLKAQVAANSTGVRLLQEMIDKYTVKVVGSYMEYIQDNAEQAVRTMLKKLSFDHGVNESTPLSATEHLDDGTAIHLAVTIHPNSGDTTFDFTGSGSQIAANLNAPTSVVRSAILYCLRCLIHEPIPLNQGCLKPIKLITEPGSLLAPGPKAAVVGGNVLTSQRLVDVIFKAFGTAAASQGCTNNLTFGTDRFGYYETIGGGAGAGPDWHGQSGVHTHMTNTRITDPEILERRYPVFLRCFSLREKSGGAGRFSGGNGLIREIEALDHLNFSILSERRVHQPYGLEGGKDGACGRNTLIRNNGKSFKLSGKESLHLKPGDIFRIETPGGGGFGKASSNNPSSQEQDTHHRP